MTCRLATIGLQEGDEGKAKVLTALMLRAFEEYERIMIERWQGGGNAGHTVVVDGKRYAFHQLPSGLCMPNTYNLMGDGMYLDPINLMKEIKALEEKGITVDKTNFGIAANPHETLSYHLEEDAANFQRKNHTSTGSGNKQTAEDKVGRKGMRFIEFLDPKGMKEALRPRFPEGFPGDIDAFIAKYDEAREFLAPFAVQEHEARKEHGQECWIGEGAQGVLLDVDKGRYPGITSSNPALPPYFPSNRIGVLKFYTSSVGTGDRKSIGRIGGELEKLLREDWEERGTTTGRDRELKWLDIVALKYAIAVSDVTKIVGTCIDRLADVAKRGERNLKIITGYKVGGKTFDNWNILFNDRRYLPNATPIYEEIPAFDTCLDGNGDLTPGAQRYVDRVQELLGMEFSMLGTGPGQKDVIVYSDLLKVD